MSAGNATLVGGGSDVNVAKAYSESFGNLDDGTVYQDRFGVTGKPVDLNPDIAKAYENEYRAVEEIMADGGSFREAIKQVAVAKGLTTGDISLPVFPREDLVDLATRRTPFSQALPRVTAETDTVTQDSVTDLGTPEIGGETDVPADDADDTISKQQLSMAYYRIRGSVSGPVQLAASTLRNSMAGEQARKEMAMRQFEENLVLNGDPTTDTTDGSVEDERGYKGVLTLAEENDQTRDPEAGIDTSITSDDVRENMRFATDDGGDYGSLINVTSNKQVTNLKKDMDEVNQVEVDTPDGTISLGARSVMVDGVPTVASDFMPEDKFASIDMRYHRIHNLSDLVMEPLAKTQDSDDFFMKVYQVFEQAAGAHNYTYVTENLA